MTVQLQPLTAKQATLLQFIIDFIRKNNYSPTRREMRDHFGFLYTSAIQAKLKVLKAKGYIIWEMYEMRSIEVLYGVNQESNPCS